MREINAPWAAKHSLDSKRDSRLDTHAGCKGFWETEATWLKDLIDKGKE